MDPGYQNREAHQGSRIGSPIKVPENGGRSGSQNMGSTLRSHNRGANQGPRIEQPIRVPVRPSPALQCTATALRWRTCDSTIFTKRSIMSSDGQLPSGNSKSYTLIPSYSKTSSLYSLSFNLITAPILLSSKILRRYSGLQARPALANPVMN